MKRSKTFRIHQKYRCIKRAYNYIKAGYFYHFLPEDELQLFAKKMGDNFTTCSCEACRNPRHSDWLNNEEKLTIQERKAI